MPSIRELPEGVWTRIAAGEVVERPGSAVKELVENALDAGAKRVKVRLWDGGRLRIVVEDDGCGIAMEELPLALTPHATSKISGVEDLETIRTLGYRGEALASLAAVSKLEIRSRATDSQAGGLIRASNGRVTDHQSVSCAPGTRVQADEIFGNLPARRKFLKSAAGELRRATVCLREYAVCRPDVAFSLEHDGREVFSTDGAGDRKRVLEQLWGKEPEIQAVTAKAGHLSLECWQQPRFGGKNALPAGGAGRSDIMAFVNGRAVNDPIVKGAVSAAARKLVGNWALFFSLDPALVDVNIHPAKAEVRFRHSGEVFEVLREAAAQLGGSPAIPVNNAPAWPENRSGGGKPVSRPATLTRGWDFREGPVLPAQPVPPAPREAPAPVEAARPLPPTQPLPFSPPSPPEPTLPFQTTGEPISEKTPDTPAYLGQAASGYLVFDAAEGLTLMDPHAAHERVAYERIRGQVAADGAGQALLTPVLLPPTLALEAEEYSDALTAAGLGFQTKEGGRYLSSVPAFSVGKVEPEALLRGSLAALKGEREADARELLWRTWASLACKSAVKLTTRLSREEAEALWRELHFCQQPFRCPHGRPTLLVLKPEDLERHFGRE